MSLSQYSKNKCHFEIFLKSKPCFYWCFYVAFRPIKSTGSPMQVNFKPEFGNELEMVWFNNNAK